MITNCQDTTGFRSDNYIVYFNLTTEKQAQGPGYFNLNSSVILEKEYQAKIKQSIDEIVEINKEANPNVLWQIIKGTIRNE